jgi:hypothetical protein
VIADARACTPIPPENFHGKGGRRFESAQRASEKRRKTPLLFGGNLHDLQRAVGMEPFMEPSGLGRTPKRRKWTHSGRRFV